MNSRPIYSNSRPVGVTDFWRWWLVIQGGLLTAGSLAITDPHFKPEYVPLGIIFGIAEGGLLILSTLRVPRNYIFRFFFAFNVIIQFAAYPILVGYAANMFLVRTAIKQPLVASLTISAVLAIALVAHIPYAMALFAPLRNGWDRGIASIYGFTWIVAGPMFITDKLDKNIYSHIWRDLLNTGVYGALVFVLVGAIAMYQWGYRGPSWRLNPLAKPWVLAILAGFCVLFLGWNTFSNLDSLRSLFIWQIQFKAVTFYWFAQGLEPGIAEEWLYRYIVLALMLNGLRRSRWQIPGAVFFSGLLFGLWHSTNVTAGQSILATANQVQFAMIAGWFLAVLYLYSGSFIVPMTFHALIDILGMMASGSSLSGTPTLNEYIWGTVMELIYVALTIWLLTGKRRTAMQWTVDNIVPGNPLHFATPFVG
ncbi:CPBP family intramembrane glutamic endopeptidase [Schleiferilactobacillus harbinensis]|uniref:CPBP family intramembrane glutamic endopeptidase n=1 Tax=Schleiferilactobacillus harbinensis TaxID=304207 RepID=UPI0039ECF190